MCSLYVGEIPKCLEDKVYTKGKSFSIKTSDGGRFCYTFSFCEKCKSYITNKGMEKDKKKVALEFIQLFNPSYELSDIVKVEVSSI
jgi:hypothetical protein